VFRSRTQKALQTPPQVGSLSDVRLGLGVVTTEEKDSRGRRHRSEDLGVAGRDEVEVAEHEAILAAKAWPRIYTD